MAPAMHLGSRSEAGPLDATPQGGYSLTVVVALASTSAALGLAVLAIGWMHIKTRKKLRHAIIDWKGAKARAEYWRKEHLELTDRQHGSRDRARVQPVPVAHPQSTPDANHTFVVGSMSDDEDDLVQSPALPPHSFGRVTELDALPPRTLPALGPCPYGDIIGQPRSLNASPLPSAGARRPPFSRTPFSSSAADTEPRSLVAPPSPNAGSRSLPSSPPPTSLSPRQAKRAEMLKWEDSDSDESDSEKERRELAAQSAALNAAVHRQAQLIDEQDRRRRQSRPSTPFSPISPLGSQRPSPFLAAASPPIRHVQPQDYLTLEMPDERSRDAA
ncbi:hypothetical protein QBC34DRAFT_414077 [Podospora aff. communis PSN243]|uniref:Uncharacterized protein n=1 Tax=Podospora aff. communis PSN243 TaxID=3040156 RepID=A0AAV9GAL1_9PEZI|nr:hypothetical protein QBC34DRAFT_414077 [Podospora aff. communis PSN243]